MTKGFYTSGLLAAGLQDRRERSAKRQEEAAKETGASLVNVPTKPPPPQTGLLGAVSAHERERKREGGLMATLTARERDRRLAEERQRRLDDFQKQQLEMVQNWSMYGPQFSPKETGASLVNVPNKPPPPQAGLLGAVSAHERERKREGGLGVTSMAWEWDSSDEEEDGDDEDDEDVDSDGDPVAPGRGRGPGVGPRQNLGKVSTPDFSYDSTADLNRSERGGPHRYLPRPPSLGRGYGMCFLGGTFVSWYPFNLDPGSRR